MENHWLCHSKSVCIEQCELFLSVSLSNRLSITYCFTDKCCIFLSKTKQQQNCYRCILTSSNVHWLADYTIITASTGFLVVFFLWWMKVEYWLKCDIKSSNFMYLARWQVLTTNENEKKNKYIKPRRATCVRAYCASLKSRFPCHSNVFIYRFEVIVSSSR